MARQKGIVKLKGTIGDISFYKGKSGYLAREKGGIEKSRIKNDPAFERTRENGAEFGHAGSAGRKLRSAFRPVLQKSSDSGVTARLTREMILVLQADATNRRGLRNVLDGELELLIGFEFNSEGKLGSTLYVPFQPNIDRATGIAQVTIPGFIPRESLTIPQGATHFKFICAAAEIDFATDFHLLRMSEGGPIPINEEQLEEQLLTNQLTAGSQFPLFLVLGIEFYQVVNGHHYPIKNGSCNSLALVAIDGFAETPAP